jgi:phage tail sheath protein FI
MPAAVTYPGVYVEEIPSGVRTITPVSTSVTAFVGFTPRGSTNKAGQIFNTADFEREFGGLTSGGDLGHAVQHYFLNGGSEAWIVRVAANARPAGVGLRSAVTGGTGVLEVRAASDGDWGNRIRVEVDYDTTNPASLFNLTATEIREENGVVTPGRTETYRNLTMNSLAPNDAVKTVNAASELVRLKRTGAAPGLIGTTKGTSTSGDLTDADVAQVDDDTRRLAITIDGDGPYEFDVVDPGGSIPGTGATKITNLASAIQQRVRAIKPGSPAFANFTAARQGSSVVATSGGEGESSSVRFGNAGIRNAATLLKLGRLNGGREVDAAALMRPARNGTIGGSLSGVNLTTLPDDGTVDVTIRVEGAADVGPITRPLWSAATKPTTLEQARARLQAGLTAAGVTQAELLDARVSVEDDALRVDPGGDPNARLSFAAGTTADALKLPAAAGGAENVGSYSLGVGLTSGAQSDAVAGADGDSPGLGDLRGSRLEKTGLYALEDVDIFNLLCLPGVVDGGLLAEAAAYCEERRAFLIVDLPSDTDTVDEARGWLQQNASLRHKNAAAYFPRIVAADPLQNFRQRTFPASGAVAGIYARVDTERGVWKAPAGTEAVVRGARSLAYALTDDENGALNPLGLNALRGFPIFGTVVWGARTLVGADQLTSQWKYIPVRRLALFIEESLYRGTKWVVFEGNDEPLWAQIRLNVGAFMQTLFRQGAFQGTNAREAYFVKCDKETTTQADIDRGVVNIVVGFAPLKPAEFVILRIQQIAGQLET